MIDRTKLVYFTTQSKRYFEIMCPSFVMKTGHPVSLVFEHPQKLNAQCSISHYLLNWLVCTFRSCRSCRKCYLVRRPVGTRPRWHAEFWIWQLALENGSCDRMWWFQLTHISALDSFSNSCILKVVQINLKRSKTSHFRDNSLW